MNPSDAVAITAQALTDLVTEIFEHTSCSDQESRRIADNLVDANLTGHDSHGVVRTGRYVDWLADGVQLPDQTLDVLIDEPTLMLVDGQYGMGQTVGPLAVELGIERADKHGLSIVALRKSGHLGRIGAFAEKAAAAGLVSMHIVNVASSQLVAPFGSRDRRMGTNPYAFGVPRPDGPPVIHDFATSIVAEGKTMVALHGGPSVPDNALVGPDGITGDPSVLYDIQPGQRPNATLLTARLRVDRAASHGRTQRLGSERHVRTPRWCAHRNGNSRPGRRSVRQRHVVDLYRPNPH